MSALSRRQILTGAASSALVLNTGPAWAQAAARRSTERLRPALDFAVGRLRQVAPQVTSFPTETRFERWIYDSSGGWVGGFWPGLLWLAWLDTGEDTFRTLAEQSARRLAPRRTDTSTHDLGFLFSPSWVTAWRLTGDEAWRAGAIEAAGSLTRRYNERGRFIRAWGALSDTRQAGRSIIDTMMNLDLLMFATEQTGDQRYADIAVAHAETAAARFVRADGSTCHVFDFDAATGAPIGPNTAQGYSATSCWARGQSWAVYGFTTMYRRTGRTPFLDTARRLADYVLGTLPDDGVPFWDYRSPYLPHDIKDSSAGAVAACGLLDLAAATADRRYSDTAVRILDGLARTCLTRDSERAQAALARATKHRPEEQGIEVSLPYADYYFMEAILRLLRPDDLKRAIGL
jgi:unsaturated chondroitin disaccharide hydrolase